MIAVLTDPAVGGTFLTWSLHYLAGHKEYFLTKDNRWIPVTNNPLTKINSHNFVANQPLTVDEFDNVFNSLTQTPTTKFHTLYLHNFLHTSKSYDPNLTSAIDEIAKHSEKIIVVTNSQNSALYQATYRSRAGSANLWHCPEQTTDNPEDIFNDFVNYFFKDSKDNWSEFKVWDQREFIALNFDFEQAQHIKPNIQADIRCYNIDTMDLFNTFDTSVQTLFNYLDVPIDAERFEAWLVIYNNWKQQHYKRLQFTWYFDSIIDGIIFGEDFDLTRFDLDIVQEAAIQNKLIRKYNLNLKTWQLEKFTNTQQLHNQLERNHHKLTN